MRAAFVVCHGVYFIHNQGLNVAQQGAALLRRQQDVKRLGGRDEYVRRARQHCPALRHQGVAGAHGGADGRHQRPSLACQRGDFAQRDFQILANVVAQRLEGRNIKDFRAILEPTAQGLSNQPIDAGEERGRRLAGAGGRADQSGFACQNGRPALLLRFRGRAKPTREPLLNERMRPGERSQ